MITKVVFKAISCGRVVHRTIPIEHPDFDVIPAEVFLGYELPSQPIPSQVIDYLDSIDKTDIMNRYGFDIILDYYPYKQKKRKKQVDELADFIDYMRPIVELYPTLRRPIEAVISEAKDDLFGHKKTNEQKAKEVFTLIKVSTLSATGVYKSVIEMLKGHKSTPKIIN